MSSSSTPHSLAPAAAPRKRREVVPSAALGMLMFIAAEVMFFAGLMSAFTINRAGAPLDTWPAPGEPRLSTASTAINTVLLMASGVTLALAAWRFYRSASHVRSLLLAAWVLGAGFVVLQGVEWAALLGRGLTLTSSTLGSFFYVIVGLHAVHAVAALAALGLAYWKHRREELTAGYFLGTQLFWYFVVLMWPVIYLRVYF